MSAGKDVWGDRVAAGPPQPFFHSRWVDVPAYVGELGPEAGLPAGFRAAGVACGIKPSGNPDLALLVCDSLSSVSATRFADTGTPAAPVLLSQERCKLSALRVILANSGCANAATGRRGLEDAAKTQGAAAMAVGAQPEEVLLGSTGGISQYLPVEKMLRGIREAQAGLRREGDTDFQQAIQTTDAFEKRANLQVELPSGVVRLSAQCKGAGMISPRFATMFCFVETDAELEPETAELLLSVCLKRSFDRCTVDGQLSTNDTAVLIASGGSGVKIAPESEDELRFGEVLDALMRQLAILMVADGEGAGRIGRLVVYGGDQATVERAARAVANSPLVKTALHGADPNWGRIVQAIGGALGAGVAPLSMDIALQGMQVCSASVAVPYDEPALIEALEDKEIDYEITLPGDGAETEIFFSDLSHEYVTINADYTT
ncbi:MAG TPA: bifunctional glutamate N-acetyltransferase/amino-acid acetyltransferase ArgJ [Solirubrobacteraceae bacterium]|nr:bifunctional glutamate N-acetyltransferase/amino-acid acetyltransferase ArgJ [Solirubrobacteraceae bacterium]